MSRSPTSSSADDDHHLCYEKEKGKFVHFSAVETTMGICWFYRSHGFCRHDSCPYQHITSANDDLYKKKASSTTITSNNNNDSSTTQCSSTILEKPTLLDNNATSPNNNSIYCWISMAKELKFAASVLRRTFEENGFTLLTTKEDFAQFNSTNNNNKKLTTSSTTNNNNNLNNEEENTTNYLPLFWGHVFPRNNIVKWYELPSYTLINHFVNSHELCNKSLMALNFQDLTEKRVKSKSEFVPLSFYLPDQLNLFINHCENQKEAEKCIWIVKPGRSGEGRGIQIYESCQQVITGEYSQIPTSEIESGIISEKSLKLCKQKIVVSKYIDNPLLIENKKFDMRMYVLLIGGGSQERFGSNTTEEFHTYFYRDAIVRFASEDYTTDLDTLKNPFIHITNNSVNDKKNKIQNETITQKFGFFSNMYLPELIPCLEKMNIDWNVIEEQIKSLVRESLQFTILNPQKQDETFQQSKSRCFQLYGYDIMINSNLKPHLLEVNSMPDLAGVSHSRILKGDFGLKSKLLANVLNLVRLQSFNTGISTFSGQVDDNNLFVKI